jgi:hypothetical protein
MIWRVFRRKTRRYSKRFSFALNLYTFWNSRFIKLLNLTESWKPQIWNFHILNFIVNFQTAFSSFFPIGALRRNRRRAGNLFLQMFLSRKLSVKFKPYPYFACEQSCLGTNSILTSFSSTVFIFPADPNLSKLSFYILFPFTCISKRYKFY